MKRVVRRGKAWQGPRVPPPRRSHPAVSTAFCRRSVRLQLPQDAERAMLRTTTTGNPGNVG